jgi:hypothetical protein
MTPYAIECQMKRDLCMKRARQARKRFERGDAPDADAVCVWVTLARIMNHRLLAELYG